MHLSTQFSELFRRETYAVNLQLNEERQVTNVYDELLATRDCEGVWDKDYSVVPIGELNGRLDGEDIPQKNMVMGYTCYGATAIEMTGKVGISKILKQRSREFTNSAGNVDEPKFAGYLADTASRGFLIRDAQKKRILAAKIFNYGGVQAGHAFFNQRTRCGFSDVPDSNLIYDGCPLFAAPAVPHPSYSAGALLGTGSAPTGNFTDWAVATADTGGYFNAFQFPPSYWSLKRVWTHFCFNMQFDENDQREEAKPDTLLVSAYNLPHWTEVLKSKFVEPRTGTVTTNTENIFMMEGFQVKLVSSVDLVRNTWFLGQAKSQGIVTLKLTKEEDPWAYWRDEKDRSYWISFEDEWGFMIRNWRRWCAGAYSTNGTTAPNFGAETGWDTAPAGV
jgi:hypothetical protein